MIEGTKRGLPSDISVLPISERLKDLRAAWIVARADADEASRVERQAHSAWKEAYIAAYPEDCVTVRIVA